MVYTGVSSLQVLFRHPLGELLPSKLRKSFPNFRSAYCGLLTPDSYPYAVFPKYLYKEIQDLATYIAKSFQLLEGSPYRPHDQGLCPWMPLELDPAGADPSIYPMPAISIPNLVCLDKTIMFTSCWLKTRKRK